VSGSPATALESDCSEGLQPTRGKNRISPHRFLLATPTSPHVFLCSVSGGELTATLKLRRKAILERHSSVVSRIYAAEAEGEKPSSQAPGAPAEAKVMR